MEMDLSKHGIPPLYIGANLGYTWADGRDELEAPVYLMNEKIAEIEKLLEEGKELPTTDDPRSEWAEEIDRFALKVILEEYKKGYEDKVTGKTLPIEGYADAVQNPRLVKYSHHFGGEADKVIFEVVRLGPDETYNNMSKIKTYTSDLCKTILESIEKELKEHSIEDIEDVSKSKIILNDMNYFGKYKWNVISMVNTEGVDKTYENLGTAIKNKEIKPIEYEVTTKEEGKDVTESVVTLKDYVKEKLIRLRKSDKTLVVNLEYQDMEFLDNIEKMLVSITSLNMFKDEEEYLDFEWVDNRGTAFKIEGYVMFRKFIPIIGDMLMRHMQGVGYKGIEEEIERVGSKMVKQVI